MSPLCAFYSSHLQQKLPQCRVSALVSQVNALKFIKRVGTLSHYSCPNVNMDANIVSFADASHSQDASQLCFIIGIIYGEIKDGSMFHLISWASHKSRRPVRSTPAAEILAASDAVDKLIVLSTAIETILGINIELWALVDSKDLYSALTTQRKSIDRSVRGDVSCIRFKFETESDVMGWIPGNCNPADIGTKLSSPLTDAVVLMLATGRSQID